MISEGEVTGSDGEVRDVAQALEVLEVRVGCHELVMRGDTAEMGDAECGVGKEPQRLGWGEGLCDEHGSPVHECRVGVEMEAGSAAAAIALS
ncbi:hypothetical protein [Rhodococcus jostii]|uniref:hypothetical protein n=1 Tax=Rhodococcus jostii TaxID=132919 RepID=UPI00363C2F55